MSDTKCIHWCQNVRVLVLTNQIAKALVCLSMATNIPWTEKTARYTVVFRQSDFLRISKYIHFDKFRVLRLTFSINCYLCKTNYREFNKINIVPWMTTTANHVFFLLQVPTSLCCIHLLYFFPRAQSVSSAVSVNENKRVTPAAQSAVAFGFAGFLEIECCWQLFCCLPGCSIDNFNCCR